MFLFLFNLWCFGIWVLFFDLSFWSYDTIPFFGNSNMNLILCFPNLLGFFFPFVGILGIWLVVIQLFFGLLFKKILLGVNWSWWLILVFSISCFDCFSPVYGAFFNPFNHGAILLYNYKGVTLLSMEQWRITWNLYNIEL